MKRFLLIVLLAAAALVIGVVVFLATFDADRYRPLVVKQLEQATGASVQLGRMSLGWHGGVALDLQHLALIPKSPAAAEPSIEVGRVAVVVRLWPLLHNAVEVGSVSLSQPRVHLTRRADGTVGVVGLTLASAAPPSSETPAKVGAAAMSSLISSLEVRDGTVRLTDETSRPALDVTLEDIDAAANDVSLAGPVRMRASAKLAGGTVKAAATVTHPSTAAEATIRIEADGIELARLLPAAEAEPHLQGRLTASFEGTFRGMPADQLMRTLAGQGRVRLSDAKIVKLNLLREALARLSMLPGLMERLEAHLPESSKAQLAKEDTVLQPIDVPIAVERGTVRLTTLHVATDLCELDGTASLGFDGALTAPLMLRIEPELSGAMVQSVKELQNLTDPEGRVEFPVVVQGTLPHVTPAPDLQYVASRVIVRKAEELLGNFLQKALERGGGTEAPPVQ